MYVVLSAVALGDHNDANDKRLIVIEDVSERKEMEEKLISKQEELIQKHTAIKVLLEQYAVSRNDIEKEVIKNLDRSVFPILEDIMSESMSPDQMKKFQILAENLKKITKRYSSQINDYELKLTPREIKIAKAIRDGYSSKEIAHKCNSSIQTINFHRRNIQKKLGLVNNGVNLNVYLSSIQKEN